MVLGWQDKARKGDKRSSMGSATAKTVMIVDIK